MRAVEQQQLKRTKAAVAPRGAVCRAESLPARHVLGRGTAIRRGARDPQRARQRRRVRAVVRELERGEDLAVLPVRRPPALQLVGAEGDL